MGQAIVSNVIEALSDAQIRADEAYPGRRIPALTGAVAAVRLGKVDRAVRTTTVEIVVMSPAADGGTLCESTALQAVEVLQEMGATCVKDVCKFDEMADVFYIEIQAEFLGAPLGGTWSAGPGYAVTIGAQPVSYAVGFSASRKVDDTVTAISNAKWQFTLEELLPPGTSEPGEATEPFVLTVSRSKSDECFSGCSWTSVQREDTLRGIRQVRSGVAKSRAMLAVL